MKTLYNELYTNPSSITIYIDIILQANFEDLNRGYLWDYIRENNLNINKNKSKQQKY